MVYKFGCFVTRLVANHCQHLPLTLLVAEKVRYTSASPQLTLCYVVIAASGNSGYRADNLAAWKLNFYILYLQIAELLIIGFNSIHKDSQYYIFIFQE